MQSTPEQIIRQTFTASSEGRLHFGEVVQALQQAGVESYTVDYRNAHTVYHLLNDSTLQLDLGPSQYAIAQEFSGEQIVDAIRGAQRGEIKYPEFKRLSMQAGCIGYTVWITGRHVTYFGRNGQTHVEHFPN